MADDVATDAPADAGAAPETPEFGSVREAQRWMSEHPDQQPVVEQLPDDPIFPEPEPAAPAADTYDDVFPETTPQAPSAPAAPAPAAAAPDPYAEFGGRQAVDDAIVLAKALQTENGVRTVVAQGLQALGYNPAQVSAFMNSPQGQAAVAAAEAQSQAPQASDPWGDIADDDVVDGATVKQMLGSVVQQISEQITRAQQEAAAPALAQIQQDRQRVATQTVDATLMNVLGITDAAAITDVQRGQARDIQAAAGAYLEPDNWDPNHIAYCIRRGAADVQARDEARFNAYVASKRAANAAIPTHTGGDSAGGEAMPEPKSAKEAAEMRKRFNLFQ